MRSRLNLHRALVEALGSEENVYFVPQESVELDYPCILYTLNRLRDVKADNRNYLLRQSYTITFITTDPDTDEAEAVIDAIREIPYTSYDRNYIADNLSHWVFTTYI